MKKIKDIFYDLNDILIALLIIAVGAIVIVSNVDTILAYPSVIAENIQIPEEEGPTNYAENPPITEGTDSDGAGSSDAVTDGESATGGAVADQTDEASDVGGGVSGNEGSFGGGTGIQNPPVNVTPINHTISIPNGSTGDHIAKLLTEAGLITSKQVFNNAVTMAGAEGKLQAGEFVIPSGATPAEIISIITR